MMHKGRLVLSRDTFGNNNAISQSRLTLNRDDSSVTKLCDLHVYRVPHELWRDSFNNIPNNAVSETVSIGIIRVPMELRLVDIREEIVQQLQMDDFIPRDFVFLRSVGRSLTTLRGKQEMELKAKHFLPPVAFCPELYILEVTPEIRDALAIRDSSPQSPVSRRMSPSHRSYNNTYRNGYPGGSDSDRGSHPSRHPGSPSSHSVNKYEPLPQITDPPNHVSNSNSNFHHHYPPPSYQNQQNNLTYRKDYPDTIAPPTHNANHSQIKEDPETQSPNRQTYDEEKDWRRAPVTKQTVNALQTSPPPVKSEPPRSAEKGSNRRHDDDSGVAELSPDDEYNRRQRDRDGRDSRRLPNHLDSSTFAIEDLSESERRRRLDDIEHQNELDRQRWSSDQEERRRQAEEDRIKAEKERRQREDQERMNKEREERRRKEEEENDRRERDERKRLQEEEEERRRKEEEENQRNKYKDDVAHFPSPPPLQMSSPEPETQPDSEEVQQQRREERERLLKELEQVKADRQMQEKEREECVKKAKNMQHKTTNRRNEARDMWKKKYFEEKKKTAPLEENSNRLRQELEALHRRLMNTLEGPKDRNVKTVDAKPSEKNNYVIQCTKLQHEIEDIQRRVENAKMKLTSEMKLRMQANTEMKVAKTEAMQNRLTLKVARNAGHPQTLDSAI